MCAVSFSFFVGASVNSFGIGEMVLVMIFVLMMVRTSRHKQFNGNAYASNCRCAFAVTTSRSRKKKKPQDLLCSNMGPVHILSPDQQSGIHFLIICGIQLLTPNNLVGTGRHICMPDIRSVSALEAFLRNCAL